MRRDVDGDGRDGVCGDQCPADPFKTTPGGCDCGVADVDSDNDTVLDCADVCDGFDDRVDEDANGIPDCQEFIAIPTVSSWGLAVLALLLLTSGKLYGAGRRPVRTDRRAPRAPLRHP